MILTWFAEMGPWGWLVFGAILLIAEILVPGVFLVWVGLAAGATGLLSLALWETSWWVWEVQLVTFAALAVVFVLVGRRILLSRGDDSDEPALNNRGKSLIGRTAVLREPIAEGKGRVHIDDTVWKVNGPDCEAGERVRIISAHGQDLTVERA